MLSWDRSLYHIWGLSGQSVGLISSLFTITDYIYIIFKYLLFILLCRDRCTIRAVTSQTSWRQLLVRTHRSLLFQSCVRLVSLLLLIFHAPIPEKVTRFSLHCSWDFLLRCIVHYRCNFVFNICSARATYSPCYQATVEHPWSRFFYGLAVTLTSYTEHSLLRRTSYIWSAT